MSDKPVCYAETSDMKESKAMRKKPALDCDIMRPDESSFIDLDFIPYADDNDDESVRYEPVLLSIESEFTDDSSSSHKRTECQKDYGPLRLSYESELTEKPAKTPKTSSPSTVERIKQRNILRQLSFGRNEERKPVVSRRLSVSGDCDPEKGVKLGNCVNNNSKDVPDHESCAKSGARDIPCLCLQSSEDEGHGKENYTSPDSSLRRVSGKQDEDTFVPQHSSLPSVCDGRESSKSDEQTKQACVCRGASSTSENPDKKTGWTYEWSFSDKPKPKASKPHASKTPYMVPNMAPYMASLKPESCASRGPNRTTSIGREPSFRHSQEKKPGLTRDRSLTDAQNKMVALIRESNSMSEAQNKMAAFIRENSLTDDCGKMASFMRRQSLSFSPETRKSLSSRESSTSSAALALPREASLSGSLDKKPSLSRASSFSGSLSSLASLRSAGRRWHASLIHIAMEIRMMVDMADLFEKWRNFKPPKKHGDDKPAELDDEYSDVFKDGNSHPPSPTSLTHPPPPPPSAQPSPSTPATTRPPPPPYHTVVMDDPKENDVHRYTNPNMFTSGPSSVNKSTSWDSGSAPKGSAIEMDSFRTTPGSMEDGRGPGGREGEANGRVAEIGIVLPIVPRPPDSLNTGGGYGSGDGGGGGGDKPLGPEYTDEKTPLQSPEDSFEKRENWENKMDFLLSVIGYAVDLANVWRFPYLCYKNGGGAFLVPYFSVLIFGAMPVFFMELSMGQFHRKGPITVWKMAPMFKGIGMASCFMAYIVAFYYNIIIGWSFFYLFSSFTSSLPWTSCNNAWNSLRCWESGEWDPNVTTWDNRTYNKNTSVTSTLEFFERGVLSVHKSTGLEDLGHVRWQLVLCTLLTFCLLYFCLWKGVKTTGKVVYLTATMPYIILTILLVRGVMLPGAGEGIRFFITPDLTKLGDPQVWIDAAVQIFFSVGAGFGTHIAYASYNKFNNNCQRDCIVTVIVNSFTSIFSGFVIFSYLGYMSTKTQKHISQVATEGPGLVFNVYPEAIATLPGSSGWAIIFFFMLLTLGIDSAFGGLESPLTGLYDELKGLLRLRFFREILTFVIVGSAFLCSIPCLTEGGIYVFTILDTFAAGTSILFTVLCQVIAVSWFYGIKQFCRDIERMTGSQPSIYWRICWKFVCPILLLIIVISSIISYMPLAYSTAEGVYVYPFYANVVGWCIALSSMLLIPGYALYKLVSTPGTVKERFAFCISPEWEHEEIRQKNYVRRYHKEHWLSI